jgi:hypothetical protein
MIENSGFAAFAMWNALKLHFTSDSYDYFKYNGKTNVSKQTFSTRKDKFQFYRLSRKYSLLDLRDFYVANFVHGDVPWVGELTGPDGEKVYKEWQKTNQALTYRFEQDIIHLFNKYSAKDLICVVDDHHPRLLVELMHNEITIETVCIMNDIMDFLPMWNKKINDDVIWPYWHRKILKYKPFIVFDKNKLKTVLREAYKEHAET